MKKILLFITTQAYALAPISVGVSLPAGTPPTFPPLAAVSFNLVVKGCDIVSAVVNGVSTGEIIYPYTLNFTSAPSGTNTIVVTYCSDRAVTQTKTFNINTEQTVRLYPRRLLR